MTQWRDVDGGARILARAHARGVEAALELAREMLRECPIGAYPWRVEIQKPPSGSRGTSVTVTFQRAGRAPQRRSRLEPL